MAKLISAVLALALCLSPAAARAGGLLLEGSVGTGYRWTPDPQTRTPTNVMLTLGYSFPTVLKLEVGGVANFEDVKDAKFDVDLRGMAVAKFPGFPLYFRGILGVANLIEGPNGPIYGGATGFRFGALGLGGFLEAGAVSKKMTFDSGDKTTWIAEGRLGFYWD